jgi:hypothetical protein
MFSLAAVIKLLQAVGPFTAALPEFKAIFDQIVGTFKSGSDQETLKQAYRETQQFNSGGHLRLQELLRQAEKAE